jgi:hypothetical protein
MENKTATSLVKAIDLQVTYITDVVATYRTSPVDIWRLEDFTKKSASQAIESFTGLAYLAYSVALRKGDAYRAQRATTDKAELFAQWLETVADVAILMEDDSAPLAGGGPVEAPAE